jgi:hypothetical protein
MNSYIELNHKRLRVEVNWNTISDFCELKGMKDLTELDDLGKMTARDLLDFIYCAIKEGERMDSKPFRLTARDLGAELKPHHIVEFMQIYKAQSDSGVESPAVQSKKKSRKFFCFRSSKE